MKQIIEKNRVLILWLNFITAFLVWEGYKGYLGLIDGNNFGYHGLNFSEFIGGQFILIIYIIYSLVKKKQIKLLPFLLILWLSVLLVYFGSN